MKTMVAKYPGKCKVCDCNIIAGVTIIAKTGKTWACVKCAGDGNANEPVNAHAAAGVTWKITPLPSTTGIQFKLEDDIGKIIIHLFKGNVVHEVRKYIPGTSAANWTESVFYFEAALSARGFAANLKGYERVVNRLTYTAQRVECVYPDGSLGACKENGYSREKIAEWKVRKVNGKRVIKQVIG